jgi:hypothetical protein
MGIAWVRAAAAAMLVCAPLLAYAEQAEAGRAGAAPESRADSGAARAASKASHANEHAAPNRAASKAAAPVPGAAKETPGPAPVAGVQAPSRPAQSRPVHPAGAPAGQPEAAAARGAGAAGRHGGATAAAQTRLSFAPRARGVLHEAAPAPPDPRRSALAVIGGNQMGKSRR